jgi:UDP-N-acetylglucosamine--N-acetylmuramyl-(pentapeptide) pyrophosphoryl-undecaprenol N-acetylglucosamine transferase
MNNNSNSKKIILSGGGTGGSVTPLLSIFRELKSDYSFLFLGTYKGIERGIVEKEGLRYKPILSGKWRRYFSFQNLFDILKVFFAFWQSLFLLKKEKPNLVISAGGFVAVPLSWAAFFLGIPVIVHQQDVVPGLANKLMARVAKVVTVTFPSALDFYGSRARWIGNLGPDIEKNDFAVKEVKEKYNIDKSDKPLVLILGGGTGSLFINNLVAESKDRLSEMAKLIHVSGKNDRDIDENSNLNDYFKIDFVDFSELLTLMSLVDLVISRCGLATLTELSFLKKASILIPMPDSHQEQNALEFEKRKAARVLYQEKLNSDVFVEEVKKLLKNDKEREELSNNIFRVIKNANQEMIKIIRDII